MSKAEPQNFWSRRRAAVQAEAEADVVARQNAIEAAEAEALAAEQAEKTDAEILEDLGLKDPDLMQMGDDFSAFMSRAVPEHLRRRALRKLWVSNPVLANLDGLCDHNDDFSDAATVVPNMKTAYQVGKGMMKHVIALAEAAEAAEAKAAKAIAEPAEESAAVDAPEAEALQPDPALTAPETPQDDTVADADALPEEEPQALPRRMRFAFAS
ncbi:MAG: DUF3306 domain-containing protein [Pseudorhodobacter sp.]|nr:DUF3306 domain-containing protein [Pseudorhodobacter sp.]